MQAVQPAQAPLSYKQVRIRPKQASFDTSGNKNIVDVEVPYGNYDLSQSELCIDIQVNNVNNTAVVNSASGDNSGKFEDAFLLTDSSLVGYSFLSYPGNDYLVKNARCESSKYGLIDSSVEHQSFKVPLNAIMYDSDAQQNELNGLHLVPKHSGPIQKQALSLTVSEGNESSQSRSNEFTIPLKNIFPSNVINNYQSGLHGDLSYHFELRLDKLSSADIEQDDQGVFQASYNSGVDSSNNANYDAFDDVPVNNTGATVNQTTLTTSIQYRSLEDSPWFVGQKILLSFTAYIPGGADDTAVVDQVSKIKSIEYLNSNDGNNGKIRLTTDGHWKALVNTKAIKLITAKPQSATPADSSITINKIELKMMELENAPAIKTPQLITYPFFSTHKDSYTQTQHQTKNYYIPPLTKTAFVVFPEAGANRSASVDAITHYRIIIDNVPVTESQILYESAKHYDLVRAAMVNAELPYKNVGTFLHNWNFVQRADNNNDTGKMTILAFPVKAKPEQQVLNIELNASANMSGQIQIVYQRVKQITAQ